MARIFFFFECVCSQIQQTFLPSPMSVKSKSFNSFTIAEQLIGGAPFSIIPENETQSVLTALCSLRHEAAVVNTSKHTVDYITKLINHLESQIKIPSGRKATKSQFSNSSKIKTPTNSNTGYNPANNSTNNSTTNSSMRFTQKMIEIPPEEIDDLNRLIDSGLECGQLDPETPEERRKVLKLLAIRRKEEIKTCNYYEVENIDNLVKYIRKPKDTTQDILYQKLKKLTSDHERACEYYDQLDIEKSRALNNLLLQQDEEYQLLLDVQQQEMNDFCETLPQFDDPRLIKFSHKYLTMRADEKNYAEGGDYEGATRLHQKADELEELERHAAMRRIITSCNLKKKKEEERQRLQRECFIARWDAKIDQERERWDKKLNVAKTHEHAVQSKIDVIKRRLGIRITSSIF
ncbi:hypothetical protein TRFO_25567 [Tritrichomonas foetus]|uniref:Uncharacterized protein n=1 Tax=Tritrichomonas foetus TaxID=1144522 RepID=A0A1J4K4S1_9EUKA|nr:hypothetical protein TRFO_25567 [Tritrichomonas foetus]|eukprot:OHT06449.1 hypothetical protein TRFO_25567 [Tritrichomonas foetus]